VSEYQSAGQDAPADWCAMRPRNFAVEYLRPDGWWSAGDGFSTEQLAEEAAREQLPEHVQWRVVVVDTTGQRAS
jgi:hypothetical protein